ncbi:hypothetical protein Terro_1137 [Terriglobus roseus DSM 18391]|uniref:Uncharacterized protein n=1 Tax=Terriglobus roseus (strain DSM 18391 / NRRL B-41598 / KBS 63) TaxID=926566 RepID=I3ZDY7_TERRK|nr:hypothetical protein [Terriglobus roseus]AFL87455.1 hypothetical protein Terro_1137 [Terriglobus roseus DSM 18391]
MSIVQEIRDEVSNLKLNGYKDETHVDATYVQIIELLERQATIIEVLLEQHPEYRERFHFESYNPLS